MCIRLQDWFTYAVRASAIALVAWAFMALTGCTLNSDRPGEVYGRFGTELAFGTRIPGDKDAEGEKQATFTADLTDGWKKLITDFVTFKWLTNPDQPAKTEDEDVVTPPEGTETP